MRRVSLKALILAARARDTGCDLRETQAPVNRRDAARVSQSHPLGIETVRQPPAVQPDPAASCAADLAEFEERTAIIDASGIPREWAEGFAHMDTMARPPGIALWRWQQIVDDAGRFLDQWGREAAALGWSPLDVFGVHREAPLARTDRMGLALLIGGGEVTAITCHSATIRTTGGALQSFRRRPAAEAGQIALWQLSPTR